MLKEGSEAVAKALDMVENDFCNLCRPIALDLCKVLADEIHQLRGAKPPTPLLTDCSHCSEDVAEDEVYNCEICGKIGLCAKCIEEWTHWCEVDQIEHEEDADSE